MSIESLDCQQELLKPYIEKDMIAYINKVEPFTFTNMVHTSTNGIRWYQFYMDNYTEAFLYAAMVRPGIVHVVQEIEEAENYG